MRKPIIPKILTLLLSIILIAIFVNSVGQDDITLLNPASQAWTNQSNYTPGFDFIWDDSDDNSYDQADCYLYINDSSNGLINVNNRFQYEQVANSTNQSAPTTFFMNRSFSNEGHNGSLSNKLLYWTIQCINLSSVPTTWAAESRILYHDNTTPKASEVTKGFTNNTWVNDISTIRIEFQVNDTTQLNGFEFTCGLFNQSNSIPLATSNTTNATNVNVTYSGSDDNITFDARCEDPAQNINITNSYFLAIDTTFPVITFAEPTPAEGNTTLDHFITINISVVELNLQEIIFDLDGTNFTIARATNCTGSAPNWDCSAVLNVTPKRDQTIITYVNDSAGNLAMSNTRNFSVDWAIPFISIIQNLSIVDSVIFWNITVNDSTPETCVARIYDRNLTNIVNITGTYSTQEDTTIDCTGTIQRQNIGIDGAFTVEYLVTDNRTLSNTSNQSGVFTNLFSGWNLLTFADTNRTVIEVCDMIKNCTQVSFFNNTATKKSFTTFSTSTPSVNNGTMITQGDAIHIFLTDRDALTVNDFMPVANDVNDNITLETEGWNTMGLLAATNLSSVWNVSSVESDDQNITWVSWLNTSASTYLTCRKSIALCAGTDLAPTDIILYKGYAVWALTSHNITVNRSSII